MKPIEITRHAPSSAPPVRLWLSPSAASEAAHFVHVRHNTPVGPEKLYELVAASAHEFIRWELLSRSPWFKAQPTHVFDAVRLQDSDGEYVDSVVLHIGRHGDGWLVTAPDETPIADTYVDERVVEEVRCLYS